MSIAAPGSPATTEWQRFVRVAVPRPDGTGWYDPGACRDPAGRTYFAYAGLPVTEVPVEPLKMPPTFVRY